MVGQSTKACGNARARQKNKIIIIKTTNRESEMKSYPRKFRGKEGETKRSSVHASGEREKKSAKNVLNLTAASPFIAYYRN